MRSPFGLPGGNAGRTGRDRNAIPVTGVLWHLKAVASASALHAVDLQIRMTWRVDRFIVAAIWLLWLPHRRSPCQCLQNCAVFNRERYYLHPSVSAFTDDDDRH
jgi:hypothetical protein